MAISTIHPVHAINKYLWSRISTEGILSTTNYSGMTPIIPVEETPEFIQIIEAQPGTQSFPYIVYNWSKVNTGQMWFLKTHQIAYAIRSADDLATRKLINLFDQSFQDYDDAARRVNIYIEQNGSPAQKRFRFTNISVRTLGGPMPSESENGVSESLVTIAAQFTES